MDPDRVPDRAWAAADFLRSAILTENPSAVVGSKPWESGWTWPAEGRGVSTGPGSRNGLRLAWADKLRLHHASVLRSMRNADQSVTDGGAWDEIARTIAWLYRDQPPHPRFVVESPDALRQKWDRIQAQRRNVARREEGGPRGADGRPDPLGKRVFRTL